MKKFDRSIPVTANSSASIRIAAAAAAVLLLGRSAQAAVFDWSATAPSVSWTDGANWSGGAAPADSLTTDIARFAQGSYANQPNAGTVSTNGIQIGNGTTTTAPLTITGASLTIGSSGITVFANAGPAIISSPITLGVAQSWTNNSGSTLTVSGNIANGSNLLTIDGTGQTLISGNIGNGAGGVVKNGSGTLVLSGVNTYTGLTTVNAGTLQIGNNDNVASLGAGSYAIAGGAQLVFFRNVTPNGLAFTNQSISGAGDVIFKGQSTGYFTLRINYTGTLSYTGKTIVNYDPAVPGTTWFQRALWLEKDDLLPHNTILDLQSGKIFLRSNTGSGETVSGLTGNAGTFITTDRAEIQRFTFDVPIGQSHTYAGVIGVDASPVPIVGINAGNISLTKNGAGTQILSGDNTYAGGTTVNGGTLLLSGANTLAGAITVNGGMFELSGSNNLSGSTVVNGGTLKLSGSSTLLGTTAVNGGTLLINGASNLGGTTSINGGTLELDYTTQNNSKLGDSATLEFAGGNLLITPNGSAATTQIVAGVTVNAGASTVTVNKNSGSHNSTLNLNGITRNPGGTLNIVYGGSGTGTASATTDTTNTTNGILGGWATVNGASWATNSQNGNDGTVAPLGAASYTPNTWAAGNHTDVTTSSTQAANAITRTLRFNTASANTVTLSGANTISSGGVLVTSNVGNNASTITGGTLQAGGGELIVHQHNTANALTINSVIADGSGATTLTKAGPGTLIASDANTYTGPTIISGGTLQVGKIGVGLEPSSIGASFSGAENLVFSNGTLRYTGGSVETDRGFTVNGVGGVIDVATAGTNLKFTGSIAGEGGVTKSGPGTLTLSAGNTYSGNTRVNAGILQLGDNTPSTELSRGNISVGAGAQLVFSHNSDNVAFTDQSISGDGDVIFKGQSFGYFTFRANYTGTLSYKGRTIVDYDPEAGGTWFERTLWLEKDDLLPHSTVLELRSGKVYLRSNTARGETISGLIGGADTRIATDQGAVQKLTITVPSGKVYTFDGEIGVDPTLGASTANIAVTKTGPGIQVLSGANSFNGGLRINEGTIKIGASTSSATAVGAGTVTLGTSTTNATLDLNGQTEIVNGLFTGEGAAPNGQIIGNSSTSGDATLMIAATSNFGGVIRDAIDGGTRKTSLTVSGGTVTLSNANTYSGSTTIFGGKLVLGAGGSLGNTASITVSGGAAFEVNPGSGALTNSGALTLESGSVFDMVDGAVGVLNLTGPGTALTIGNTPTTGVTLNFDLSSTGADSIVVSNAATVASGVHTIGINTFGSSLAPGTYTLITAASGLGGTFQFAGGLQELPVFVGTTNYRLVLSNTGTRQTVSVLSGLLGTWAGAGSTTNTTAWATGTNWANGTVPGSLGTTNNFDTAVFNSNPANSTPVVDATRNLQNITFDTANVGALNLSGNALTLTRSGVIQTTNSVTNNQTISAPLIFQGDYSILSRSTASATLTVSGAISAAAPATLILGGSNGGANTISGLISNGTAPLSIRKSDAGTWILSNPGNSFTGNTHIDAGVLRVMNGALGSNGNIVFGGGALQYATGNTQDLSGRIKDSTGAIAVDTNGNNITFANPLSTTNTGGLTKTGVGTLTLSAANAYTGPTTISGGTLRVGTVGFASEPSTLGASSNGAENLVFNGGTLQYTGTTATTDRGFTLNAAGGTIDVATADTSVTFLGAAQGAGGITKTGSGKLILAGVNGHAGTTTAAEGILQIGDNTPSAALSPGNFTVASGAQLVFSRNNDNVAFLTQSISGDGDVVFTGQSRGYFTWRNDYTGKLSYTGKTIVNYDPDSGGTWFERGFWLEKDDLLPHSTVLDVQSAKVFLRNNTGAGETISGLTGKADTFITTDQSAIQKLTFDVPAGKTYNYEGVIGVDTSFAPIEGINQGNIAITKTGAGTQILSGDNTYSGTTTINGGTLLVSGSISGAATSIGNGGTLATGATGTVHTAFDGDLAVNSGGTLSPGGFGAVGTLTLDIGTGGKLNFATGSTLEIDLGIASDVITFLTADDWLEGSGNLTLELNGAVDYGRTYTVFQNVTTAGFTLAGVIGFDSANYNAVFAKAGNNYQLSFAAVPEPATAASLFGGVGLLLGLRRFRRYGSRVRS